MGRNTSYFGSWGTDTPKRSKSLSHIITWLIPVGESEQEFQKATKTLHPLLPLKKKGSDTITANLLDALRSSSN